MPNIKSADKRMRQSRRRRMRNRHYLSRMRTEIKRFRRMLEEGRSADAGDHLPKIYTVIDHTAQKGVIHRRTAARYKSRLTHSLNRILAASSG